MKNRKINLKTRNGQRGQAFMLNTVIRIILVLTVVAAVGYFSPRLYGGIKTIVSLAPETCGTGQKTAESLQNAIQTAVKEEKIPQAESQYDEWAGCNFDKPLDDETHFTISKAVYDYYMKQFEFSRATRILRDYLKRTPKGKQDNQAQQMTANAESQEKESPSTKLGELAKLETQNWIAAKEGYKTLLNSIATKSAPYQTKFAKESAKASERYIKIEADQIKDLNLRMESADIVMEPSSGSVKYTIRFTARRSTPTYTIEVSTASRSVEHPDKPLNIFLRADGADKPMTPPTSALDIEANTQTARTILERIDTQICKPEKSGEPQKAKETLKCLSAPIANTATSRTLLPIASPTPPLTGSQISFQETPSLPTKEHSVGDTFQAEFQGQKYRMNTILSDYPTATGEIVWTDMQQAGIGETKSNILTRSTLITLCPKYQPPKPYSRDMRDELVRCLASRQVFSGPYLLQFKALPTTK